MSTTDNDIPRPVACPRPGQIQAFDAGWDAHKIGLERETVRVVSANNGMSLLAWDIREDLTKPVAVRV